MKDRVSCVVSHAVLAMGLVAIGLNSVCRADGGKHYGHLEVSITEREDGAWVATFDPVYEFFTTNETGEAVYGGTRHYADKVEIVNESTIRRDADC